MLRRRSLLKASATLPFAMALSPFDSKVLDASTIVEPNRLGSEQTTKSDWIDAHVHVWTPDISKYPLSDKYKRSDMAPPSFTPEELFHHCKPEGVAKVVLIQMSFYGFDNRYMLDSMEKHSGVFSGVAIVDETRGDLAKEMKSLGAKGVRGFRLYTDKEKATSWKDSKGMNGMWSAAADMGQAMCLLANPDALPIVYQMCDRYPRTRVVVDHFARIGVSGTIQSEDLENLCRLAKFENVFVKTSAFYALGKKKSPYTDLAPMIQKLVGEFGSKRLMWASDCPYQVVDGHSYADSIGLVRDKLPFLTAEDKSWLLRETAQHVFF